jgi:hypothetical protein
MKFLSSLDRKDRSLLLWCVGGAITLAVLAAFLTPSGNDNDNPLPSSYLAGRHGARAAYETLLRSGYAIERWDRPLHDLAETAGPETVVIIAQPYSHEREDAAAVEKILERGGRVLATGYVGGIVLPGEPSEPPDVFDFAACKLDPEGLDPLASSGEVWMTPRSSWSVGNPIYRVQYRCSGQPSVVEFDFARGHAVWWASSTPLENGSITRGHNLDLFLNSLGPRDGHSFYWDESLHGDIRSEWSYAGGPALTMLWFGLAGLGLLIVLSFSRRSGPVRDLPPPARATPIEFLDALGSLYRNAGAASTAVAIAWERFRRHTLRLCGQSGQKMDSAELAAVIRRRFPKADAGLEADLAACEEAAWGETINPRQALKLIQTLHSHRVALAAAKLRGFAQPNLQSNPQERAS